MFDINIKVYKKDINELNKMPKSFEKGLYKGARRAMFYAEAKAKRRFNTPGNLKVRSGHYRRSIRSGITPSVGGVTGYLAANVVYASIHEYGGIIYPTKGKYLKFVIGGKLIFAKKVVIPARPLITPAITENLRTMGDIISRDVTKEVGE